MLIHIAMWTARTHEQLNTGTRSHKESPSIRSSLYLCPMLCLFGAQSSAISYDISPKGCIEIASHFVFEIWQRQRKRSPLDAIETTAIRVVVSRVCNVMCNTNGVWRWIFVNSNCQDFDAVNKNRRISRNNRIPWNDEKHRACVAIAIRIYY